MFISSVLSNLYLYEGELIPLFHMTCHMCVFFVFTLEPFIQNFSTSHSHLTRHLVGDKRPQPPQSLIQEVTTDTFLETVMDSKRVRNE